MQVTVDGKNINLSLWDTAGQETYNRLRRLSYGQADVFLIVFSVLNKDSFKNVINKYYPELCKDELENVPKLIVGTQIDQRDFSNADHIKTDEARKRIQTNCSYFECSARTQEGGKEVIQEAIRQALKAKQNTLLEVAMQQQSKDQEEPKNDKPCCIIQ